MKDKSAGSIRVLIANKHEVVREGLAAVINRQTDMDVVAEAYDGQAAVERFVALHPHVALLDVHMLEMDGIAATKVIREQFAEARIILLSTYSGDEQVYQGLRAGAMSYLLIDTTSNELVHAIHQVHSGVNYIPPSIAAKLADRVKRRELSTRETEVLQLMAYGKSNKEIGSALYVTEGTVKVHVSSLMKKLGVTGRIEAVNVALMHGIVTLALKNSA